jgi:hypothetical protein
VEQDDLLVPAGACLVHVGPFKTGSSAIQAAFSGARDRLPAEGVVYPGTGTRPRRAGWAVLGTLPRGRRRPTMDEWDDLVQEVAGARDMRVCISNEDFGRAGPQYAARIVEDLGRDRVHVVAVARRLDKLLPSQWQERVRCYETLDYEEFLRAVLDDPERRHPAARAFWQSHDMGALIERWASQIGPDRVTVIVTENAARDMLPRTFERMLGLREGFLQLDSRSNPSVSYNGIELFRRVNEVFAAQGWPDEAYHHIMQNGVNRSLQTVPVGPGDEPMPPLPPWAADRVRELSQERVDQIKSSGARVVGDLAALVPDQLSTEAARTVPETISIDAAVKAVEGAVRGALALERQTTSRAASRRGHDRGARQGAPAPEAGRRPGPSVSQTPARELLAIVARRGVARLRRLSSRSGGTA